MWIASSAPTWTRPTIRAAATISLAQLDNRSRGYNALKDQTAVDDRIRSILTSACYRTRKLNFGDDARGEVRPTHELLLDHG
jgi:hypothetical protein